MTLPTDRGVALLEVLIALVILTTAGSSLVALVGAGLRWEHEALQREQVLANEERLIAAMTLLKRRELDQRIGRHDVGEFVVDVQRPEPTLYRIAIAGHRSAHVEDLVTVVFRTGTRDGAR